LSRKTADLTRLSDDIKENLKYFRETLGIGESFDVMERELEIAGRRAALIFIDGLVKDDVMALVLKEMLAADRADLTPVALEALFKRRLPYVEVDRSKDPRQIITMVLSGPLIFLMDGFAEVIIIDARSYPAREPQEPELERVLRGSRDGLVETLIFNTALIRRRIRDPNLRVELVQVGDRSRTDVALIYIKDVANTDLVDEVRERLQNINVGSIPMAEKTVEEFLLRGSKTWWNPFPQVRYTERPDVAAVHLFEGHVVVAVDTSPSVIILPVTLFHHLQHAEEYREDVAVGAYFRLIRFLAIFISWFGLPLWLALVHDSALLPPQLAFIGPREPGSVPLGVQFLLAEMGIDIIRLALIHVPSTQATSLGFIGAIILGEVATRVGLFANETILYVALAALGGFATPSLEFSLAVRLSRIALLILAALFGLIGLGVGVGLQLVLLLMTRSFRVPYLWPLIPLNWRALVAAVIRKPLPMRSARPSALRTRQPDVARTPTKTGDEQGPETGPGDGDESDGGGGQDGGGQAGGDGHGGGRRGGRKRPR